MNFSKILVISFIGSLFNYHCLSADEKLLIIDSALNHPYVYRNTHVLAQSVGFLPDFRHITAVSKDDIEHAQAILLILDPAFLSATSRELAQKHKIRSPLLKQIYQVFEIIKNQKNKVIMIALPSVGNHVAIGLSYVQKILKKMGVFSTSPLDQSTKELLTHLLYSGASKSYRYDTALLMERENKNTLLNILHNKKVKNNIIKPLPDRSIFEAYPKISPLYPLGFHTKNLATGNDFIITSAQYLTFADIAENFTLNPVDFQLRLALLSGLQEVFAIFHTLTGSHKNKTVFPKKLTPEFSLAEKKRAQQERKQTVFPKYYWIEKEGIACGWMAIDPFNGKENEVAERLLKSGLNMLWLQLNPEIYFSDNAFKTSEQKKEFLESIFRFTAALKQKSIELKLPLPHVFIGMEISGNFGTKAPVESTKDMYGKNYTKVPSPLDFENYWQKEVIEVFDRFYEEWQHNISNNLPLAGIFLDFEMYHAQNQTGQYTNLMDFSDLAWQKFYIADNNPNLAKLNKVNDRVKYLIEHNQLQNYFGVLKQEAKNIGKKIKNHINNKLPTALIAAYNITLPHSWLYKGIMAGLSSAQEPLILATFNNNFYAHYQWLKKNQIYLYHMPVLLFSKLQKDTDFSKIKNLWQHHDGIWFNRYSRLEEPQKTSNEQWDFSLETTPLETKDVIKLMNNAIQLTRKELYE